MTNPPQISIIIPTWNTYLITKKCLDTIYRFHSYENTEVIVVDNHSTDNTGKLSTFHHHIVLHSNIKNFGYAKACNIGASLAHAPYLLFLNSDMEFIGDKLFKALHYLSSHPQTGIIAPQFLNLDLTHQGSVFPSQNIANAFKEFWLGQNCFNKYAPSQSSPQSVWAVSGGAILISTSLYNKIGGWNEKYFMYFEDLDLCRQVRTLGLSIEYLPQWQLIHHHGASGHNLVTPANQWRRLIAGSRQYHGPIIHPLLNFVIWSGQKWRRLFYAQK